MLVGHLTAASEYQLGDNIVIRFELSNNGQEDLFILPWFTPLEGLVSPCLSVYCDGLPIPYDGPFLKRTNVSEKDYQLLRAGETLTREVTLNEAYPIMQTGEYTVSLNTRIHYFGASVGDRGTDNAGRGEEKLLGFSTSVQSLEGGETRFIVRTGSLPRVTLATVERQTYGSITPIKFKFPSREIIVRDEADISNPPKFEGGDAAKRELVTRLHSQAYFMGVRAYKRSRDSRPDSERWFGTGADMMGPFYRILRMFSFEYITYDLDGRGCIPQNPAWAYLGSRLVHLCSRFWTHYGDAVPNSQTGIIYHELTHCVLSTSDYTYGVNECLALAQNNPATAQDNADNFQYFAEGL